MKKQYIEYKNLQLFIIIIIAGCFPLENCAIFSGTDLDTSIGDGYLLHKTGRDQSSTSIDLSQTKQVNPHLNGQQANSISPLHDHSDISNHVNMRNYAWITMVVELNEYF